MLTYDMEGHRKATKGGHEESLYIYLYECIRNDILNGTLRPEEKLPSKRSFARNLGVSVITVESAYAKLEDEGYIESAPKKGFFVQDIPMSEPLALKTAAPVQTADGAACADKAKAAGDAAHKEHVLDLSSNASRDELFPLTTWSKIVRGVLTQKSGGITAPSPAKGLVELRRAIAGHLYAYRGLSVSEDQIIVGAGTEYLYSLIIQLIGFHNTVAVEDPGYPKLRQIYEAYNVSCIPVAIDGQGIHVPTLNKTKANIVHVSPSHHFPTGLTTSISRRYELLGWAAQEEDRYIIEDDYDAEFRLNGHPIPTLQSIDTIGRVIYLNTFTKSLSATMRISYMVLPAPLMRRFEQMLGFYSNTVSTMQQYTLERFISSGSFESHINRLRRYGKAKRDATIATIRKKPRLSCATITGEDAGLYFLLHLPSSRTDAELKRLAREKSLNISFISEFYSQKENSVPQNFDHTVIINYMALEDSDIERAVDILESLMETE